MGIGDVRFARQEDLLQIDELWGANRKTLGFYPLEAFRAAIIRKCVFVESDDGGEVYGYLLFRLSKHRICVTHLCTSGKKSGVAKRLNSRLVDYSRELDLDGLDLHCRRDYDLQAFWKSLGYFPINERPGRGKAPSILVHWAIRHFREDLFSNIADDRIVAILDTNVLIRIDSDSDQAINQSAKSLVADWLESEVKLTVSNEVYLEIDRQGDDLIREKTRSRANHFERIEVDQESVERTKRELLQLLEGEFGNTENDQSDLNHLAIAIACEANYFITHDENLRRKAEHSDWKWSLRVTDPTTLIVTLDETIRDMEYSPGSLAGTDFQISRVGSSDLDEVIGVFRSKETDERAAAFSAVLRTAVANTRDWTVECVRDSQRRLVFLYSKRVTEAGFQCGILRSTPGKLEGTISRHMLSRIVNEAIGRKSREILLHDTSLSQSMVNASKEFGFMNIPGRGLWKPVLYGRHSPKVLLNNFVQECKERDIEVDRTRHSKWLDHDDVAICTELESVFWPAKLDTERLPTYVVPIRPYFAMELFDRELALMDDLFGSQAPLALACENVYYRKNHNVGLKAPGRVLWYVSKGSKSSSANTMTIRACSMLNEVVVDTAKKLFQRFKRLGIYDWRTIATMVGDPAEESITALRFSHTELFNCPVELEYLRGIGVKSTFQCPVRITSEQFAKIYDLGTNRGR